MPSKPKDEILIISSDTTTRGFAPGKLKVDELTQGFSVFVLQMKTVLEKTPSELGPFGLDEIELHAEVTGKGSLALLGTGGEVGAAGGIKFVFRRSKSK